MRSMGLHRGMRWVVLCAVVSVLAACGGGGNGGGSSTPPNTPPIASAGSDGTAFKGESVELDGSGSSDADGHGLTYTWTQTSGPSVGLTGGSTARPTFVAPSMTGVLAFSLAVSDGRSISAPDSVAIEVLNRVPTANAGPDRVAERNETVTLAGSGSFDPDRDALRYTWTQLQGEAVLLTQSPNGDATFTAPALPGVLEFSLSVSDSALTSNVDTVLVSVGGAVNGAPYVDAGWDQASPRNSLVTLYGWVYDAGGAPVTISWTQVSGPPVTLSGADTATPTFEAPDAPAILEFQLTASNGSLTSAPDAVLVEIRNFAPSVSAQLTPQAPRTLDDLVASVEIYDADGDDVESSYVWRRNGVVLAGFTGTTLPDTQFVKGDVIDFSVSANDSYDAVTATASATVVDTPAVFVANPPSNVDYGDTFSFTITATDPDESDPIDTFELRYGPAGMEVSNGGVVTWPAVLPMFGRSQDVNYAVELVGNEVGYVGSVSVNDANRALPMRRTGMEIPARDGALKIADLDNDGDAEVLVASPQVVHELAWDGAAYVQRWAYPFHLGNVSPGLPTVDAADVIDDARLEIFIAAGARVIRLDGPSRAAAAEVTLAANEVFRKIELADLDGDGGLELIGLVSATPYNGPSAIVVVNPSSMQVERRTVEFGGPSSIGFDFAVGNVDNDAPLEIVTGLGYVFDGVSGAAEWAYGPGFGDLVETGDVDNDGVEEIAGLQDWTAVRVFDAVARSPVWDIAVSDTDALLVSDVQGDGAAEILLGDGQWGEVTAYRFDPATSQAVQLWTINSQGHGVTAIDVGDVDDDGALEFVWGTDATSSGPDSLVVAGLNPAIAVEWINSDPKELDGAFIGGELAQVSAGDARLLFGSPSTDNGYGGAHLVALDPLSGEFTVSDETGTNWSRALALDVVDYDDDGDAELFLGTSDLYSGYFTAYNFATNTEEWRSPADVGVAQAMAHADLSGDGFDDMITIAAPGSSGGGPRIHVFDPRNSNLIWRSVALTGAAIDVAAAQLAGDSTPEIIAAASDRITVYQRSGATFLEIASYAISDVNDLLVADADGDGEQEIYVLSGWTYDRRITRLSRMLTPTASYPVPASARSLHLEGLPGRRNIVVSSGDDYYWSTEIPLLRALDPATGEEIWRSPGLSGVVSRNSLYYVDPDADGRPQISFGAGASMYLTR